MKHTIVITQRQSEHLEWATGQLATIDLMRGIVADTRRKVDARVREQITFPFDRPGWRLRRRLRRAYFDSYLNAVNQERHIARQDHANRDHRFVAAPSHH